MTRTPPYLCILTALLPTLARAQTPTAPATRPAVHALVLPPGFKLIQVAGRNVVAEPADEPWVRTSMAALAPVTRPSPSPADLVDRLTAHRAELAQRITADLALPDPKPVQPFLDATIAKAARYRDMRPPVFYLATTHAKLLALVKAGWEDPRYHYNPLADEVMVDTGMYMPEDGPVDDILLPATFLDDAPPDARAGTLVRFVQQTERVTSDEIARRARVGVTISFISFVIEQAFQPLNLKPDQDWLGIGAANALAARYDALATGTDETHILDQMTAEGRNPFKSAAIDLLHPQNLSVLRDESVPYYLEAVRVKSTAALRTLTTKAGPDAITKVITALRQSPPADPPALLALIKRETNVDLTPNVTATAK